MNYSKSKFRSDLNGETVIADFLDRFLYPKLDLVFFRRNQDLNKQYRGIDMIFNSQNEEYIIDEKAQLHYPKPLPTFAFEIQYKKNGNWKTGWLYDDSKETDYYLLVWPHREDVMLNKLELEDIKKAEVMLISRQSLQEYLDKSFHINKNNVAKEVEAIINNQQFGKLHYIHPDSNHYFFYTKNLAETPINIVIQKNTLKELAMFHFIVYRNTPYSQKNQSKIWLKEKYQQLQNK